MIISPPIPRPNGNALVFGWTLLPGFHTVIDFFSEWGERKVQSNNKKELFLSEMQQLESSSHQLLLQQSIYLIWDVLLPSLVSSLFALSWVCAARVARENLGWLSGRGLAFAPKLSIPLCPGKMKLFSQKSNKIRKSTFNALKLDLSIVRTPSDDGMVPATNTKAPFRFSFSVSHFPTTMNDEEKQIGSCDDGWKGVGWGSYYVYKSLHSINGFFSAYSVNAMFSLLALNAIYCILSTNSFMSILSLVSEVMVVNNADDLCPWPLEFDFAMALYSWCCRTILIVKWIKSTTQWLTTTTSIPEVDKYLYPF